MPVCCIWDPQCHLSHGINTSHTKKKFDYYSMFYVQISPETPFFDTLDMFSPCRQQTTLEAYTLFYSSHIYSKKNSTIIQCFIRPNQPTETFFWYKICFHLCRQQNTLEAYIVWFPRRYARNSTKYENSTAENIEKTPVNAMHRYNHADR